MKIKRLAFIMSVPASGMRGGAEVFNDRLLETFRKYVPYVEPFPIVNPEITFLDILKAYVECYDLDLSEFDGVVSAKAPTFAVRHPNHVCYLLHTVRVFYDMFDEMEQCEENRNQQKLIQRLDTELLSFPHVKQLFTIGHEVSRRLELYNGLSSTVIHPGLPADKYFSGEYGHIFMPGRLHRWKRVDLMIKAMRFIKAPVRLKIAGTGEDEAALRTLASGDKRIEFLGYVTDEEMKKLYATALVVPFLPVREDYGMVLHEAWKSKKPVVTCVDSGEPAFFVKHGINGFVVNPNPEEVAQCVETLYSDKSRAAQMGERGRESISHISWENVAETIMAALER